MPWNIKKKGDEYCVIGVGKEACHDTRQKALDHLKALYANVDDVKEKEYHPDVYYINESISHYNSLIEQSQYCIRYAEHDELKTLFSGQINNLTSTLIQLINYRLDWYSDEDQLKEKEFNEDRLIDKMFDKVKGFFSKPVFEPIQVIKQTDGSTRVLLRVSNIFKDRHGEIITTEAHKDYVKYVDETRDYPEFWLWHTKGTRWGQADLVYFDNGFLTMSGLVDSGSEYIAEGLAQQGSSLGVSHGFRGVSIQGKGYIDRYRSFEASPLPRDQAANIWTAVMLAKEATMGLDTKHREFFKLVGVPDSRIEEWDQSSKDLADILKESGIQYKEEANDDIGNGTTNNDKPNVDSEPSLSDVLSAVNALGAKIAVVEDKQKALEAKVDDPVASVLEAAVERGKAIGDPATKANDNQATNETMKKHDDWETHGFSELFIGTGSKS